MFLNRLNWRYPRISEIMDLEYGSQLWFALMHDFDFGGPDKKSRGHLKIAGLDSTVNEM